MTAQAVQAAAPPPATTPRAEVATQPRALPTTSDTPALLRRLSLVLVVTGVVVGLVGALSIGLLAASLDRAQADTAQLVRVQRIETDLLVADANATNTFLVGGLESAASRAAYENALAEVGSLVAAASDAQPADANALAALNTQVLDYAELVEAARANNRQGFPVGATYLRLASTGLRTNTLPVADALVAANAERARDAMSAAWGWPLVVVALLGLGVFVYGQVWLARRFRRRLNAGVLTGSLLLLGLLLASAIGTGLLSASVSGVRNGGFADVNDVADARVQANLAKSSESLTLIARGSGGAYEQTWQAAAAVVEQRLGAFRGGDAVLPDWKAYEKSHVAIRELDDAGQWDSAVAGATASGAGTANGHFQSADALMSSILDSVGTSTQTSLGGYRPGLVIGVVLALLAGLAAAFLGRRGVAVRQREYR